MKFTGINDKMVLIRDFTSSSVQFFEKQVPHINVKSGWNQKEEIFMYIHFGPVLENNRTNESYDTAYIRRCVPGWFFHRHSKP